ncbi:MAG: DNA-binding protein [Bdellovibrionales bacterium]|nr:DNA-binding protein [Bdellovibrionales bacterium]
MARLGIDEAQVFEAADSLRDSGLEPTIQAIREKLGTGSFATISSHLKKWRELKIQESPIPKETQAFLSATKQIWATAWREAESSFEEQRKALLIEKEQWASERDHLLKEIEGLESESVSRKKELSDLEALLKKERSLNEKIKSDLQASKEESARMEAKLESSEERRKEAIERGNRLEKELAQIAKEGKSPKSSK